VADVTQTLRVPIIEDTARATQPLMAVATATIITAMADSCVNQTTLADAVATNATILVVIRMFPPLIRATAWVNAAAGAGAEAAGRVLMHVVAIAAAATTAAATAAVTTAAETTIAATVQDLTSIAGWGRKI